MSITLAKDINVNAVIIVTRIVNTAITAITLINMITRAVVAIDTDFLIDFPMIDRTILALSSPSQQRQ